MFLGACVCKHKTTKYVVSSKSKEVKPINEPIVISDYNELWPKYFEEESEIVKKTFSPGRVVDICHYGSTSVRGMKAKPVVDIMIGVSDFYLSQKEKEALQKLGYSYLGKAWTNKRYYLRKRGERNFNLVIVKYKGQIWRDNLLVRNYLRTHPNAVIKYIKIKEFALKNGNSNLIDYSNLKYPFVRKLINKARDYKECWL